jgi:hypothetical protein
MAKFRFNTIHSDKTNKQFWRYISEGSFYLFIVLNGCRILVRERDKHKLEKNGFEDVLFWFILIAFMLWLLLQITYWIKPSWFKMNKVQNVQVCDTST